MRLFDHRRKFRNCEIFIGRDLDQVYVLERIPPNCLPCPVCSLNEQEFLLQDGIGKSGIEILNIFTACDQLASGGQNSRAGDAAGIDRVTQFRVSVNSGVTQVANGRNTALKILASQLCAHQGAFGWRFYDGQQQPRSKKSVSMAVLLRFGRHNDVKKQVRVAVNQSRQQGCGCRESMIFAPAGTAICEDEPTCLILSPSIRTAAGASTFPVRGSSSRAAFTRVTGAADWPRSWSVEYFATSNNSKNTANFRIRFRSSWRTTTSSTTYGGNTTTIYVANSTCKLGGWACRRESVAKNETAGRVCDGSKRAAAITAANSDVSSRLAARRACVARTTEPSDGSDVRRLSLEERVFVPGLQVLRALQPDLFHAHAG